MNSDLTRVIVRTTAPDYVVEAEAVRIGADVLVFIWGGDRPHIGAVAAAQPRASLAEKEQTSATSSVLTYLGHKEDEVVKLVAEALASALNTQVVVTAGIHWDDLSGMDIKTILQRCQEVIEKLQKKLQINEAQL